jgi:hypothetical protein
MYGAKYKGAPFVMEAPLPESSYGICLIELEQMDVDTIACGVPRI